MQGNPDLGSSYNNLAWLLALQGGREDEALSLANRAIELDGAIPDLLDTRALAYLATGRGDLAIQDLEEAIAVSPAPDKSFHLARAYALAGRRREADEALQEARDAGLRPEDLHPLERATYQLLLKQLERP
jgi:tetratricopeptide (TPR) repeat protein